MMRGLQIPSRALNLTVLLLAPALVASSMAGQAHAAVRAWNVGDGNWSVAGNWSPAGVPGANDTVNIFSTDGVSRTITYDYTGAAITLASVSIDLTGGMPTDTETFSMSANNLTAGFEYVGYSGAGSNGSGTFNQSGGVNTINGTAVYLGLNPTDNGYYNLSGTGSLVGVGEVVGYNGTGTFTQSGGTNAVGSGSLYLGYSGSSGGDYEFSAGTLSASAFEFVGYGGTGLFDQFGGTNSPILTLYLGYNAGSSGTYNLSGNSSLTPGANEIVGDNGSGTFNQSGGTNKIPSGNILYLGYSAGSSGIYALTGGTLTNNGQEYVGLSGAGTFNQSGGSHTVGSDLTLAFGSGSSGAFSLSGNGALTVVGSEYIGRSGTGTFTQTGGTNQLGINSTLYLGFSAGSSGTYTLAGGVLSLTANGNEYIGYSGTAAFDHSAGTNNPSKSVYIGYNVGSSGTYSLGGSGALALTSSPLFVGYSGTGAFVQSGGGNAVNSASVYLAFDTGSSGSYALSGGSFVLSGSGVHEFFGYGANSNASFTQTGGTNQLNGTPNNLYLGYGAGATGTYTLSGGSVLLAGSLYVGVPGGGTGTMTVSGAGQLTVGKTLQVSPGSMLNLNGGQINASTIYFSANPALFNWTTGTLNVTTDVTWDPSATGTTSAAFGPGLALANGQTLMISGNETIGGVASFTLELGAGSSHIVTGSLTVNPAGALTVDPGSSSAVFSSFTQNGGTVNGTLQLAGPFNYDGGVFNGRLITQGASAFSANFTAPGGMENDGMLTIGGPRTLTFNGPGLNNSGTITLAAGQTLIGTAIVNAAGGSISSSGTIAAPFTNFGTLDENATTGTIVVTGLMLNYGYVGPITSGVSFRPTGGLDNAGAIQLNGGAISGSGAVTNDFGGLIQSGVGMSAGIVVSGVSAPLINSGGVIVASSNTILNLTSFAGGNVNGGEVRVQDSATLTSQLAFPNSGTILLQGAAATLAGGALANTGTISGLGRVSNIVGNDGVIQALDGTLTLAAAGNTNHAATSTDPGGQIQAGTESTVVFSQGLAANAGTIALAGGTFDNNDHPITNAATGFIIGAGTFKSGGLTNNGIVRFADNPASVYGSATTAMPGSLINLINNTTTFYGPVTIAADSSLVASNATARFLAGVTGSVTPGVVNNGAASFAGANAVYGTVVNAGASTVDGNASVVFNGQFSGPGSIANRGTIVFNTDVTAPDAIGGVLTNTASSSLIVEGDGLLEVDAAPTFGNSSAIFANSTSRLKFNVVSGSATIGRGVMAVVSSGATLELAGSVSALGNGSNRVNITNNSGGAAAGILVSGTQQVVGNIDGSGVTQIDAGSDLTANHIVQSALIIGGTSGSPAIVTIEAGDSSGNPLGQSSGLALAGSLTPIDPFGVGAPNSSNLLGIAGSPASDSALPAKVHSGTGAAVPEPRTLLLALVGLALLGSKSRRSP
jgi:hypothetical protein